MSHRAQLAHPATRTIGPRSTNKQTKQKKVASFPGLSPNEQENDRKKKNNEVEVLLSRFVYLR